MEQTRLGTSTDTPADPRIGTVLAGRYRVLRRLGEGGMGVVYAGEDERLARKVAIKCLHATFAMDAEVVGRFRREATATGKIGDEHIVDVRDIDRLPDGTLFMVQELLDGRSLSDAIGDTPLTLGRAVHILEHVCDGLVAAHAAGIVHRDLKPENVFLVKRGADADFAKILDFGISKFLDAEAAPGGLRTRTGTAMGTPYYMAPEQAMGRKDVDHRADLWALGVMLFRMLSARYPFESDAYPALMMMICHEPPPALRSLRPELPEGIERVIERLLEKDREARFASAAEVKAALAPWRTGSPAAATDPFASTQATPPIATRPAAETSSTPARRPFPISWLAITGVIAAGSIVAIAMATSQDEDPSAPDEPPVPPIAAPTPAPEDPPPPALTIQPSTPVAVTDAGATLAPTKRTPPRVAKVAPRNPATQETAAVAARPPPDPPPPETQPNAPPRRVDPAPPRGEGAMPGVAVPLPPRPTIGMRRRDAGR